MSRRKDSNAGGIESGADTLYTLPTGEDGKHEGSKGFAPFVTRLYRGERSLPERASIAIPQVIADSDVALGPRELAYMLTRSGFKDADGKSLGRFTHDDISEIENTIERMRRGEEIDWDAISDSRTSHAGPWVPSSPRAAGLVALSILEDAQLDRQIGQPHRVELWAEAAGWLDRLVAMGEEYGVETYSGSGSVPVDATRAAALRVIESGKLGVPTVIPWIGDLDVNGLRNIATPFAKDVRKFVRDLLFREHGHKTFDPTCTDCELAWAFADEMLIIRRLMITAAQVEAGLVPREAWAPVEKKDRDAGWPWPFKVQAEALLPADRERIVRAALDHWLPNEAARGAVLASEPAFRYASQEALAAELRASRGSRRR
jgi:hypothetical protein